MKTRHFVRGGLGLVMLLALGCGGRAYRPVTGTVTLDGDPLADTYLAFVPVGAGEGAYATTDEDGHFDLSTHFARGAAPGEYKVIATALSSAESKSATPRFTIPEIYTSVATTPLKLTLPPEGALVLELTSDPTVSATTTDR